MKMKNLSTRLLSICLVMAIFITTGSFLPSATATSMEIPDDAITFNGHYYKAYDISMTWTDAKAYCEELGGHLVTVTSQTEQTFLENTFFTNVSKMWFYMIGGYRQSHTSTKWMWVTGEPFSYSNWSTPNEAIQDIWGQNYIWVFSPSAPDSYVREDGVVIEVPDYKWVSHDSESYHEVYNTNYTGFICEWDTNKYVVDGRTFDKNIDYFTSFKLSSEYNPELANMTAALSKAIYNETAIKDAYASLGFPYCVILDDTSAFDPLSSAYSIGVKNSEYTDEKICLITVRGSKTLSDWIGNFLIKCDLNGKHAGFARPADRIFETIKDVLGDDGFTENVRYVITGHSRGAAVANLLAVQLMENDVSPINVYNYNFACPDVACKLLFENYVNIFNLCNREDVVPFVPGDIMSYNATSGFSWGKFGQTYWFTKDSPGMSIINDHDMGLYLEFFDEQKMPSDWEESFWDKVADGVHWTTGIIAKIHCPVDVVITDLDGNKIASVFGDRINYYDSDFGDVIILTDGDQKAIYISGNKEFNVELFGTDTGTMTYSVEKCNLLTDEILESKTFENVKLKKGKEMLSPVSNAETIDDIELFVVEEENGITVNTHLIDTDGKETEIYHIYETEVVVPTCTEKGYTEHICVNCSDTYRDSYVDALGHSDDNYNGICDICSFDFTKDCSCNCHKDGIGNFFFKIARFFWQLFGIEDKRICQCNKAHW